MKGRKNLGRSGGGINETSWRMDYFLGIILIFVFLILHLFN